MTRAPLTITLLILGLSVSTATGCASVGSSGGTAAVVPSRASADLHGTDISDVVTRPALRLRTTQGQVFDLRHRPADEVTLLFFGYTRCPDLCPAVMADLASARRKLPPPQQSRVQIVFVTEDPRYDTPQRLRVWLDHFDPSIIGLVGGNAVTQTALDALKTTRTELTRTPDGDSQVAHTGSVYAFAGSRVVVYTGGTTPPQYAEDLRELLR